MFDSWYSSCKTLHFLQSWSWKYMVGINSNRVLIYFPSPYQKETIPLKSFLIDQDGLRCRLKSLGIHRCFSQSSNKLGRKYWCTNHTNNGKHSNVFLFSSNTITEVWNNTFWLRSVRQGKYTSRLHTSASVCVLSQRYKGFDKENESVWPSSSKGFIENELNNQEFHPRHVNFCGIPRDVEGIEVLEVLSWRCCSRATARSGKVLQGRNTPTYRTISEKPWTFVS